MVTPSLIMHTIFSKQSHKVRPNERLTILHTCQARILSGLISIAFLYAACACSGFPNSIEATPTKTKAL